MKKRNLKEYINRKFGRLTIISEGKTVKYIKNNVLYVNCICECGTKKEIELNSIIRGKSKSCGCYSREISSINSTKHGKLKGLGKIKNLEYHIWIKMKSRCNNPNDRSYKHYGKRGIKVCERWMSSYVNFIDDLGERPEPKKDYSLERIDVNGDYCPENCKWVLKSEQSKNQRRTKLIKYNNKSLCLADWCRELNLSYSSMRNRINVLNMDFEEALKYPKYAKCKHYIDINKKL